MGLLGLLSCSALQLGAARRQFVDTVKVAEADRSAMAAKIYHHNKVLEKRLASGWAPPQPNRSNRRSLGKRQSGNQADLDLTLTVSAGLDSSYFTNITIGQGDEATEFAVIPDTGSAGQWRSLRFQGLC